MFGISLNNKLPIYEQLIESITRRVLSGVLEPNSQLPSVRELAAELAVNPNTVQKAFTELERLGVAYSVSGKGRFVTDDADALRQRLANRYYKQLDSFVDELVGIGLTKQQIISHIDGEGQI